MKNNNSIASLIVFAAVTVIALALRLGVFKMTDTRSHQQFQSSVPPIYYQAPTYQAPAYGASFQPAPAYMGGR